MKNNPGKLLLLVLLFSFFTVLSTNKMYEEGIRNRKSTETVESPEYRRLFYSDEMLKSKKDLSVQCRSFLDRVKLDVKYFPIPESTIDDTLTVSYVDSWMGERKYKGTSGHEGTDIMAGKNERGLYPVVSMSDGVVTNIGWLEKGGYRIGITSPNGVYFYYAHLESYASIKEGDDIQAGELLGFMGDSGYGEEGTVGKFDVHLHLGIYSWDTGEEISVNPYYVLLSLNKKKLKYSYS